MEVLTALEQCRSAARHSDLMHLGVSARALARAVATGLIDRSDGVYHVRGADPSVVAARRFRGVIGCLSAAAAWGLPLREPVARPHIVVPAGRSQARRPPAALCAAVVHRSDDARGDGICADPLTAIDQAAWCIPPAFQLALADAALRLGLIVPADLHHLSHGSRARRSMIAGLATSESESYLESLGKCAIRLAGLPMRLQVNLEGVGRVDSIVNGRLVVEFDGRETHLNTWAFAEDRRRDRAIQRHQLRVARFTFAEVSFAPLEVATEVATLCGRRLAERRERKIAWAWGL